MHLRLLVLNNSKEILQVSGYGNHHELGGHVYSIKCWNSGFICAVVVEFPERLGYYIFCSVFGFRCLRSRSFLSV